MATQEWHRGHLEPFWNDEYCSLSYGLKSFNSRKDIERWRREGYVHPQSHFTGFMCDMRNQQPSWNNVIIHWAETEFALKDIGTSYYKMGTGVILPNHRDTFKRYRELFNCTLEQCERIIIFLQDWESGHYFEIEKNPVVGWKAGDYYWWRGDVEHMAANIGTTKRYTLQITGHK